MELPFDPRTAAEAPPILDDVLVALAIAILVASTTVLPRLAAAGRIRRCREAFLAAAADMNDVLSEAGAEGAEMRRSRHRGRAGVRIRIWDGDGRSVEGWTPGLPDRDAFGALLLAAAGTLREPASEHRERGERAGRKPRSEGSSPIGERRGWWSVLGVREDATRVEILAAWRDLARTNHPDAGGSTDDMARINAARDKALRARASGN